MITKVEMNITLIEGDAKKIDKRANLKEEYKDFVSSELMVTDKLTDEKKQKESKPIITSYRALWVIDEKNNVFIRIEDENGNVVKEIPPEDIINLKEKLSEISRKIFKIEV